MYNNGFQQKTGLPTKFETFRQNIELTDRQREKIKGSHTHLRQQHLQRLTYVTESFLTGSYKKRTMIRPPSDVDAFVVLNVSYYSTTPNSILRRLKSDLQLQYQSSTIRQDKPSIVLEFNHCSFDLTPAIKEGFSSSDRFYIPKQGGNEWVVTDSPRKLEQQLSQANSHLDGKLTPIIKMMKVCKRFNNIKDISSYQIEETAIRSLSYVRDYRDGVQKMLRALNWTDSSYSHWDIEQMTDEQFASYCRNRLFGNDFPS